MVLRSGERDLELREVPERSVHVVVRQLLEGDVGLPQEDALAHDAPVLHTDLKVRPVQSSVCSLQEAGKKTILRLDLMIQWISMHFEFHFNPF